MDINHVNWDQAHKMAALETAARLIQDELDRHWGFATRTGLATVMASPIRDELEKLVVELKERAHNASILAYGGGQPAVNMNSNEPRPIIKEG